MQLLSRMIACAFLSTSLLLHPLPLSAAHLIIRKNGYNHKWGETHSNRSPTRWGGWQGNPFGWPSYYAYYRYPIAGSIYYYSFPTNSSFYYSYPSYSTNWTYPSYPYVGKYYVNDAPIPANRLHAPYSRYSRTYSISTPQAHPFSSSAPPQEEKMNTSVFINE